MLTNGARSFAHLPAGSPPYFFVVVDTEEEFDWSTPLSRENVSVASIGKQGRAQEIFARYGVRPTYVVDFPVANDREATAILRSFRDAGVCEIGAHLHPWVNPPHDEQVTPHNSYPGNLPEALEREKLRVLTETIAESFGATPVVYKAGRYGLGPNTARILASLGYKVDTSIVPRTAFVEDGGPDFRSFDARPYWFGDDERLLELPVTCGFAGLFSALGPATYPALSGRAGMSVRAPGVFARLNLVERIRLTPEGAGHAAHRRLTESLLDQDVGVFCLSYHSPSLAPGNTPYVRDEGDLADFLETLDRTCRYFVEELGARSCSASELCDILE